MRISHLPLFATLLISFSVTTNAQYVRESKQFLRSNWQLQSSAALTDKGEVISTSAFQAKGWYPATVPSTVVGTLVEDKVYPEPFFDQNLRKIPGCSYPIGANFSNLDMPADSPFRVSWWYRTQLRVPAAYVGKNIWLNFDGINFRANVWLNGKQIANSDEFAGTFRNYELNIKDFARVGDTNVLAVEVFPQQVDDLGWTFVDWNPMPPDKNMGIYRDVYLVSSGPVTIRHSQVVTHFESAALDRADLTINLEVQNATDQAVDATVNARLLGIQLSQQVKLEPKETKAVSFSPDSYQQLKVRNPKVWWPIHLGPQTLHLLETDVATSGRTSDQQIVRFGIREVTAEIDAQKHLGFKVNGRNVLIRGGGWASDMFLRFVPEKIRAEFRYVKEMNLNAIRLEGQLQPDYFYDLADQEGILILAGWCCCSHWEHWTRRDDYQRGPVWDQKDYEVAAKSQTDQIKRLRNHPSLLVWMNGSDNPPPSDVEKIYVDILKQSNWPNPYLSSATAKPATLTGESGVKMEGPYEWVPPSYWQLDTKLGGAHGFATEISPGPAVPPVETLKRILPDEHLWPIDDHWNFHAGGGQFKTLKVFTSALEGRYGPAKDLNDYAMKSQLMAYEGQRAMFEGFGGSRYKSTGVIQWMLNNAWPGLIWHLYDYYLMPGGGYFGTKVANEPVHIQYSYSDKSIVIVNTTHQPRRNLRFVVSVYDIESREKFTKSVEVDLPADANIRSLVLPDIPDLSSTYFLKLTLEDARREAISSNFYWLSTRDDVLDWQKSTWYYTPTSSYADLTQLGSLPKVKLNVAAATIHRSAEQETAHITIANPTKHLAFFIQLQIKRGRTEHPVLPVVWQDNYVSLLPGETKTISATYDVKELGGEVPTLVIEGFNSPRALVPLKK